MPTRDQVRPHTAHTTHTPPAHHNMVRRRTQPHTVACGQRSTHLTSCTEGTSSPGTFTLMPPTAGVYVTSDRAATPDTLVQGATPARDTRAAPRRNTSAKLMVAGCTLRCNTAG